MLWRVHGYVELVGIEPVESRRAGPALHMTDRHVAGLELADPPGPTGRQNPAQG
jgi:hypothetical protein